MYNDCSSLTSRHKITLDGLACHQNPLINCVLIRKIDSTTNIGLKFVLFFYSYFSFRFIQIYFSCNFFFCISFFLPVATSFSLVFFNFFFYFIFFFSFPSVFHSPFFSPFHISGSESYYLT